MSHVVQLPQVGLAFAACCDCSQDGIPRLMSSNESCPEVFLRLILISCCWLVLVLQPLAHRHHVVVVYNLRSPLPAFSRLLHLWLHPALCRCCRWRSRWCTCRCIRPSTCWSRWNISLSRSMLLYFCWLAWISMILMLICLICLLLILVLVRLLIIACWIILLATKVQKTALTSSSSCRPAVREKIGELHRSHLVLSRLSKETG